MINSVDRDGTYLGYDLELVNNVCENVHIPVIACGGAKNACHIIELFKQTSVSAASAANFFHFTEHSVNITKSQIQEDFDVRLETHANYVKNKLDFDLRLAKKDDQTLEHLLYLRIEKEII